MLFLRHRFVLHKLSFETLKNTVKYWHKEKRPSKGSFESHTVMAAISSGLAKALFELIV